MPSFSCTSSVRVVSQDHTLRLKITHNLVHGLPSDAICCVKGRLPKELDVLWLSDLTISLSGSLDGHQIPVHDVACSGLVRHLQSYLKANSDRLGLNNVSPPFTDDTDGLSKLTLTLSRSLPHASRPHANLVSLHLAYIWRTITESSDILDSRHLVEEFNPFSPTLFLPTEALLNRATEQFLIYHLVGRYPLIFGAWCKRLDQEMQYFPSIGRSILEIMARSQNHRFLSKCKRLLKIARSHHKFVLQTCTAALSSCTDDTASATSEKETDYASPAPVLADEQVLCESLEQLYRVGVPQRRFKPTTTPQFVSALPQDDDDGLLPWVLDDETSWIELPETGMLPHVFAAGSYQTLPESMDVFAEEDWHEGGLWRFSGTDTSPGKCEFDTQSDESLISASFPLTSITTHSPQACPVSLYHHLDADDHELNPAASVTGSSGFPLEGVLFANVTHSPSHAPDGHDDSQRHGELTQEAGTCQADSESFEPLDNYSEREEVEDPDGILFDLDGNIDTSRQITDTSDFSLIDVDLDWDSDSTANVERGL